MVTGPEFDFLLVVAPAFEFAEHSLATVKGAQLSLGADQDGRVVTGIAICEPARSAIEDGTKEGNELSLSGNGQPQRLRSARLEFRALPKKLLWPRTARCAVRLRPEWDFPIQHRRWRRSAGSPNVCR